MKTRKILAVILAVVMLAGFSVTASASNWWMWDQTWGTPGSFVDDYGRVFFWGRNPDSGFPWWEFGNTAIMEIDFTLSGTINSNAIISQGGLIFVPGVAIGETMTLMGVDANGNPVNLTGYGGSIEGKVRDITMNGVRGFNVAPGSGGGSWETERTRLEEILAAEDVIDGIAAINSNGTSGITLKEVLAGDYVATPASLDASGNDVLYSGKGTLWVGTGTEGANQVRYGAIGTRTFRITLRYDGGDMDRLQDALNQIAEPGSELTGFMVQTAVMANTGIPWEGIGPSNTGMWIAQNQGRIQWATNWGTNARIGAKDATVTFVPWASTLPAGNSGAWGLNTPFTAQEMREISAAARDYGAPLRVTAKLRTYNAAGTAFRLRLDQVYGKNVDILDYNISYNNQLVWMVGGNFDALIFDIPANLLVDSAFDWNLASLAIYHMAPVGMGGGSWETPTWSLLKDNAGLDQRAAVLGWEFESMIEGGRDGWEINPTYLMGDLNFDGRLSAIDALMALQISSGLLPASEVDIIVGDLNGDGKITASDALAILELVVLA
ncbi:MAG: dockerin type I repeat-containing protein [Oscillospiraceae bacterium]|nr:dockerin type I repeat-containing protein [Oscillospiraceae bacterium]